MGKSLVAYFSASGTTEKLAKTLSKISNSDLFKIEPTIPYTQEDLDWTNENSRSTIEMKKDKSSRPAIANKVENMDQYDVIYIGFPIWWYVAPKIINTFLESYDFSGKTIIPFATSGGSGMGKTEEVLKNCCSKETKWKNGRRFESFDEATLKSWIDSLKIDNQ